MVNVREQLLRNCIYINLYPFIFVKMVFNVLKSITKTEYSHVKRDFSFTKVEKNPCVIYDRIFSNPQ